MRSSFPNLTTVSSHVSLLCTLFLVASVATQEIQQFVPAAACAPEPIQSLAQNPATVVEGAAITPLTGGAAIAQEAIVAGQELLSAGETTSSALASAESAQAMRGERQRRAEVAEMVSWGMVLSSVTLAGCLFSHFIRQRRAKNLNARRAPKFGSVDTHTALLPGMLQVYGCPDELSRLNGMYEKRGLPEAPGEHPAYYHCVCPNVTLKRSPACSSVADSPGHWAIWSDGVQLLVATTPSSIPVEVAWGRRNVQEQHPPNRIHCIPTVDPGSAPVRFESCVADSGSNMAPECLLHHGRKVLASGSVATTAFTSPLGPEDWTLKFRMRTTDLEVLGAPMIGVVMSDMVDFYSLERELNTSTESAAPADPQRTGPRLHDFTWVGAAYVQKDHQMLPIWSSNTFVCGGFALSNRDDAAVSVDLRNDVDFLVTIRWTRISGVQVRFGEHEDWKDMPGRLGRGCLDRFNEKIGSTGLARAFVRIQPESGSVSLLSSKGDLHALKQSLIPPADLSKMYHELLVARSLGASAAEIQELSNETAGRADERAEKAFNQAIRDWVDLEIANTNSRRASERAYLCERSRTYAEVAFPADWTGRFAGRTGYAAFQCGDNETPFFERFLRLYDSDPRHGLGLDAKREACTSLQFIAAWRIENPELWRLYQASRKNLFDSINRMLRNGQIEPLSINTAMQDIFDSYPWEPSLESSINEVVLCHGTHPQALDDILTNGLSQHYTRRAAFGSGVYFADEPGKAHLYAESENAVPPRMMAALHEQLYTHGEMKHPDDVRYMIISRVLMGHYIRSDGRSIVDDSGFGAGELMNISKPGYSVWDANAERKTELAKIPGTRINYHALYVDKGSGGDQYREFVQFHGNRVYPVFVVAYRENW